MTHPPTTLRMFAAGALVYAAPDFVQAQHPYVRRTATKLDGVDFVVDEMPHAGDRLPVPGATHEWTPPEARPDVPYSVWRQGFAAVYQWKMANWAAA